MFHEALINFYFNHLPQYINDSKSNVLRGEVIKKHFLNRGKWKSILEFVIGLVASNSMNTLYSFYKCTGLR